MLKMVYFVLQDERNSSVLPDLLQQSPTPGAGRGERSFDEVSTSLDFRVDFDFDIIYLQIHFLPGRIFARAGTCLRVNKI